MLFSKIIVVNGINKLQLFYPTSLIKLRSKIFLHQQCNMLSVVSQTLVIVSSSVIPEQRTLIFGGSVSTLSHCTSSISSYFRGFL